MKAARNPPDCLREWKQEISARRDALARGIESLHEVKTYLPESGERSVTAAFEYLARLENRLAIVLADLTRIEAAYATWRHLQRAAKTQYERAARSLLDAWFSWRLDAEYQPRGKKDIDRAARTAVSALRRLIALWERHAFLRDIKLIDALPLNKKNIDLLDCIDEPLPVVFDRIISAIDEHERSGGNQRSVPRNHELVELAYQLTWQLHSDTGLTAHKAVAALTSCLLNKTISEAAVRRAWDRSLKERPE